MRRWLARRERLGLTLRELSVETGVPAGTLGHWAWKLRNRHGNPAWTRARESGRWRVWNGESRCGAGWPGVNALA